VQASQYNIPTTSFDFYPDNDDDYFLTCKIEYNGDKYSDKNINIGDIGIEVASDDKDTIINNWNKARECGKVINSKNIDYPKFGFKLVSETENSNSVAHTLIQCMGYKDENIGLFNPGEKSLLINVN
jgi:hypothetical protein